MRTKKVILILVIIIIGMTSLKAFQLKEYAISDHNILFVTNDSNINDELLTDMLSDLGRAYNITVTNVFMTEDISLEEDSLYTDIIIQSSYDNLSNQTLSTLENAFAGDTTFFIGMPWTELTETEKTEVKEKCDALFSNTSIRVLDRVYTNLLEVKESGIDVADSNGALTRAGELTLACTYITEITKSSITGLTSYDGVSDTSVKTIVDKVNETLNGTTSTFVPSQDPIVEDTNNTTNSTNIVNTTSTTNKTTKKSTTATGTLKADPMSFNYRTFKSDREPRIRFITGDTDYVYLDFCDCAGIKSEHTGDKNKQPKVYTCSDNKGKNKKEIKDLKRPTLAQYKKQNTEYVYTVGIPSKYVGEKKTFFYAVAYDSDKSSDVIREYFSVKRKTDGTFSIDRAPRSVAVTTSKDMSKIGFLATDYSGIASVKARTIKKDGTDTLGEWNGTVQKDWSQVNSVTASKKNVVSAISSMNKVSTFFKNRTWKGKNPKVKGKDGVYKFVIETKDASGLSCVKTMSVDTTKIHVDSEYETVTGDGHWEIKNGKYIYHYSNGTKKTWTVSEYKSWKKLKENKVKAKDPKAYKKSGNGFSYDGIYHKNYHDDYPKANEIAIKNGTSPYAITVDVDRRHESVFKMNNGVWEPYKSSRVNIGEPWKNVFGKNPDSKIYSKTTSTPIGLYYLDGNRYLYGDNTSPTYWVQFGVKYKNGGGHGWNNGDYLHKTGASTLGNACTQGCVTTFADYAKWIYENCGRGTPVLIY